MAKADIQKILLTGEDRPDLYSVHKLQADPETQKPQVKAEFHGVPINYPVEDGFEACDTTLLPEQVWEFEYVNRKNNFTSYFNDRTDPNNPTLASFEIINSQGVPRWINYKMYGITTPSIGVPDGNKIIYSEVFPNVDLEYIVDTWRLKENIIIKQSVEYYGYKFTLKLDENIVMEQQEDGSIDFIDSETDERLWGIEKPYAKDAENNRTDNVRYILGKEIYNEIEYDSVEVLIEDADFIANATYPIVIDPTTVADLYDSVGNYGYISGYSSSYGTLSSSHVFANSETLNMDKFTYQGYTTNVALWQYNTSSIPDDATILNASVQLYCVQIDNDNNRNAVAEYFNYGSVSASYFTFNVGNNAFNYPLSGRRLNVYNTFMLSNVGNINKTGYTKFRGGTSGGAPNTSNGIRVESPSRSHPPKMSVTYNIPPTTPTLLTPNGGEEYNEECDITWQASTDPDGDSITYHLQYSPNNGSDWYDIATGRTGTSYTWDTSSLAAGTQYRVRIRAYDGYSYSVYDQSDAVFTIKHITDQVNIGGELKEVDKRYVNIEGVLKEIDWIKVNVGGVLKDT